MEINDATIHSSNVYNDILNDIKNVSQDAEMILLYHKMMLIFNKISNDNDDEKIYNLLDNKSLVFALDKGVNAWDIHDLIVEYQKKDKSPFFSMEKFVDRTLFNWYEITEILEEKLQHIVLYVMAYPFEEECIEIYKRYVTSQIDLQSGISRLHK